jgi:hypothetical protein
MPGFSKAKLVRGTKPPAPVLETTPEAARPAAAATA